MDEIKLLMAKVLQFRDERDWGKFHNAKDLAAAISIEASELLEVFLWKGAEEANPQKIKEELADVLTFALLLANQQNLDIVGIVEEKIKINAAKYPIEKSRGSSTKYTEL